MAVRWRSDCRSRITRSAGECALGGRRRCSGSLGASVSAAQRPVNVCDVGTGTLHRSGLFLTSSAQWSGRLWSKRARRDNGRRRRFVAHAGALTGISGTAGVTDGEISPLRDVATVASRVQGLGGRDPRRVRLDSTRPAVLDAGSSPRSFMGGRCNDDMVKRLVRSKSVRMADLSTDCPGTLPKSTATRSCSRRGAGIVA